MVVILPLYFQQIAVSFCSGTLGTVYNGRMISVTDQPKPLQDRSGKQRSDSPQHLQLPVYLLP